MILPGVPRTKRIQFVKTLVKLLFSQGLEGITDIELSEMSCLVNEMLKSVETVSSKPDLAEEEESTGSC